MITILLTPLSAVAIHRLSSLAHIHVIGLHWEKKTKILLVYYIFKLSATPTFNSATQFLNNTPWASNRIVDSNARRTMSRACFFMRVPSSSALLFFLDHQLCIFTFLWQQQKAFWKHARLIVQCHCPGLAVLL